jgi:hypothetical protein
MKKQKLGMRIRITLKNSAAIFVHRFTSLATVRIGRSVE